MQNVSKETIDKKIRSSEEGELSRENLKRSRKDESLYRKRYEAKTDDILHYRALREKFAARCFGFMIVWSILILLILIGSGFSNRLFHLSDTVLSVLLGTTSVHVIGLVFIIVRGLFSDKDDE